MEKELMMKELMKGMTGKQASGNLYGEHYIFEVEEEKRKKVVKTKKDITVQ